MTIMLQRLPALILIFGFLLGTQALAKNIYRWVDEKGVAHYGDQPTASSERMRVRDGKVVGPTDEEKQDAEEMSTLRKEQCDLAQSRYNEYTASNRLIEKDEFGKERELSHEERLNTIAKSKEDVEAYCNKR